MSLQGVTKGKRRPPRIVIYGPPKIGKSTLGASTPSPIFVTTEEGADCLDVDQFEAATDWRAFIGNLGQLAGSDHEYKTLVIDTLNGAAELAADHVCRKSFDGNWGPRGFNGFGAGWAATAKEMSAALLPVLDACRRRGMAIILLAHTGITTVRNPILGDFSKFQPDVDKRVWASICAWADIILRADFEYSVVKVDGKNVAKGGCDRVLRATGSAAEDAGCRAGWELPETLPLSWTAIYDALHPQPQGE